MTPTVPIHPWAQIPTGNPNDPRFAHLFTRRPDNDVNNPRYERPGAYDITGAQAYALVAWLNSLGFIFSEPRVKGGSSEGALVVADRNGPPAIHYAKHADPTPENPDDSHANNLAQIADAINGTRYGAALSVIQLGKECGINPLVFAGLTDQAVVDALKRIFG